MFESGAKWQYAIPCMYVLFIDRFQIHDKNIKNIFTLIKENCPEDQMKFKCIIQAI